MLAVVVVMAGLWWGGRYLGWPRGLRLALVVLAWGGWLAALGTLPGHSRREFVEWALLAPLALAAFGYMRWLAGLRRRVAARAPAPDDSTPRAAPGPLSSAELARYSRHILLHDIGGPGQRRLKAARVLVVGAGGLGSPVLQYLAAAGVGTLGVIDDDVVEASNLHRQPIHTEATIGQPKVVSAAATVAAQNPHVVLRPYRRRLTPEVAAELFADYDLILDGTDNFDTRYLVGRTAAALGKPLISGALTPWEGQVSLFDPAHGAPCYDCVFPERPDPGMVPACSVAGVAGPLPGVIGTMMALEAVKEITGAGDSLRGRLLIFDGLTLESRIVRVRRRDGCAVCGPSAAASAPPAPAAAATA